MERKTETTTDGADEVPMLNKKYALNNSQTTLQRINILVMALREISSGGATSEPDVEDYTGNPDDQYSNGMARANYFDAQIARKALKEFGGCECDACRDLHGYFHFSDCAVHSEPAMPNGPCDCEAMP